MELPVSTERKTVGAILGIAGLVALVVGGFQSASAQAHYMDAINVYNDGVQPRPPPGFQPQSPVPLPPPAPAPATPQPPPATPQPPPATPAPQAYPPPPATAPAPPSP
jgi:hypothetical protein